VPIEDMQNPHPQQGADLSLGHLLKIYEAASNFFWIFRSALYEFHQKMKGESHDT